MHAPLIVVVLLTCQFVAAQEPANSGGARRVMCGDAQREEVGFWHKLPAKEENNCWYANNASDTVIVFIHGIFSDSRDSWKYVSKDDQYWPEIVSYDDRLKKPSIFLAGYYAAVDSGKYDTRQAAKAE